jgi:hypothetical protein
VGKECGVEEKKPIKLLLAPREARRDSFLQRKPQIWKSQKNSKRKIGKKGRIVAKKKPVKLLSMSKEAWWVCFLQS